MANKVLPLPRCSVFIEKGLSCLSVCHCFDECDGLLSLSTGWLESFDDCARVSTYISTQYFVERNVKYYIVYN